MPDVMDELSRSQRPLAVQPPAEEPRRSPVKFIVLGMLVVALAAGATTSMPSTMTLTGERRGSSAGGCTASGLCDLDNSSITSGILYYYPVSYTHLTLPT